MDTLANKHAFKRSFKNVCVTWGLIVSFLAFHICVRNGLQDSPLYFIGAAIMFGITALIAHYIRKRLDYHDIEVKRRAAEQGLVPAEEVDDDPDL